MAFGDSFFDDVGEFHAKFGLPAVNRWKYHDKTYSEGPYMLAGFARADVHELRVRLIHEELHEFHTAVRAGDLAMAADALADTVWVLLGTAHAMGLPFNEIWEKVREANMAKERATGNSDPRSKRRSKYDIVKPEGWQPPDLVELLRQAGWEDAPPVEEPKP